ncbi:MAG: SMI1/KNR4 family protein [Ruminococcus sp.]|nr:SMI1/KNR4 family protein [Ruminococcus sp.]
MENMKVLFDRIIKQNNSELNPPVSKEVLDSFLRENKNGIAPSYLDLLSCFNGGEIFIPGTVVFGIGTHNDVFAQNESLRVLLDVPRNYLIFAKLNFGDYVCVNNEKPYNVIQWDHENNELFCEWDSIYEWLEELVIDFDRELSEV